MLALHSFWLLHLRDAVPGINLKVFRTVIFIPSFILWTTEEKWAWGKGTCPKPDCKRVTTGKYSTWWWEDCSESPLLLTYLQDPSWLGGSRWDCYKILTAPLPKSNSWNKMSQCLANTAAEARRKSIGKLPAHPFERKAGIVAEGCILGCTSDMKIESHVSLLK